MLSYVSSRPVAEALGTKVRLSKMAERRKFIIDCDAGIDDAQAIMIALSEDVDLLAVTCVHGNTKVDQVTKNVLKVLEVCGRTDVPVHKGASVPLLGKMYEFPTYHGRDGLGDALDLKEPDLSLVKSSHAVSALTLLVRENPNEVTIVAMGPLTNVALACRMDPQFSKNVKSLFIMGGNVHGVGNNFISAEFNFGADPEAAYVVLNESQCPLSIVPWEVCLYHPMEWQFFYEYIGEKTPKSEFLKIISSGVHEYEGDGPFITADPFIVGAAIHPEMVLQQKSVHATVELSGCVTRGQLVVDWREKLGKGHNINIIEKMDIYLFQQIMMQAIK